jgi:hypothetical protein
VRAAGVLLETNQEFAIGVLLQVTRQGRGLAPLEAASRLVPYRPDVATDLMDYTLPSSNPLFRAAALELHRSLRLEPSRAVRALLLDPQPLVQLRAVETVLAWAARQRGRADRQDGDGPERRGRLMQNVFSGIL